MHNGKHETVGHLSNVTNDHKPIGCTFTHRVLTCMRKNVV